MVKIKIAGLLELWIENRPKAIEKYYDMVATIAR